MLTENQTDLLALCAIDGLNWHLIAREAQRPGGLGMLLAGKILESKSGSEEERESLFAGLEGLDALRESVREKVAPAWEIGARLTTVVDDDYPLNLRSIFNLPPFLFYLGKLEADDVRSVAVVGTRHPTPEGEKRAFKLAGLLAENSVAVMSGLALGIDTAAHEGTLAAGGRTVAVMGTGICLLYPPKNRGLSERIVSSGGALVSQFWPKGPPATYTFPRRNVTMSGMSQGTVVIEASSTSGAKMQARLALEHGKKVFLLKSLVETHDWARKYLLRGAVQVEKVETIIEKLSSPSKIRSQLDELAQLQLKLG